MTDGQPADRWQSVEALLDRHLPPRDRAKEPSILGAGADSTEALADGRRYLGSLADGGWSTPHWPLTAGGAGLDDAALDEFEAILDRYERPDLYLFMIGLGMAGPMIVAHGTPEQHARYLEQIRTGQEVWCQLFSEPTAGSDLANMHTSARLVDGRWHIKGHKIWVSRAAYADHGLLLARTEPGSQRHAGLTVFLLPMNAPGLLRSPIKQMNGDTSFAEVFFDDVQLDDSLRLGEVGHGWSIAMSTLAAERRFAAGGATTMSPADLIQLAAERGVLSDPVIRNRVAEASAALMMQRINRTMGMSHGSKVLMSRTMKLVSAVVDQMRGPQATLLDDTWSNLTLTAPSLSIRGGTDEIQLNVLAERVLGLPREPRPG